MQIQKIIQKVKPGVPKRYLMIFAAVVWTFAGGMLLYKGSVFLQQSVTHIWVKLIISAIGGILFYLFMFSKISLKHARRILNLEQEKPCLFSFFSVRSYILMSVMISMGIFLRKSGLVPVSYLSVLYVTMGIPLFTSAFRFYYFGFLFNKMNNKK
jgi:uncharacterized membrane protein